jgi:hypothetical protein
MMRRLLAVLILATAFLAPAGIGGCTADQHLTVRRVVANTQDTFIAAVVTLNAAYDLGEFSADEWNRDIKPKINEGNALVSEFDDKTKNGLSGDSDLAKLADLLTRLDPFITRAEAAKKGRGL